MANLSQCLTCEASSGGYDNHLDKQLIRNGLGGQQNQNGTIQYITNVSLDIYGLWFRVSQNNFLCDSVIDENKIPNKVVLEFPSNLEEILKRLFVLPDETGEPIKRFDPPLNDSDLLRKKKKSLFELLTNIEFDEEFLEKIKESSKNRTPTERITAKSFSANILTLKPENWDTLTDFDKKFYVHENKSIYTKSLKKCPVEVDQKTFKYLLGQGGIWVGGSQVWESLKDRPQIGSFPTPPEPAVGGDVRIIRSNFNDPTSPQIIDWRLALIPINIYRTGEEISSLGLKELMGCAYDAEKSADMIIKARNLINVIKNTFFQNSTALCDLLRYIETNDNIIQCNVKFYKDDKLLPNLQKNSNIKVTLDIGYANDVEEGTIDFNKPLFISVSINDENIEPPNDPRSYWVRLECPDSIELANLENTPAEKIDISGYITAELIQATNDQRQNKIHTSTITKKIYSEYFPYCENDIEDLYPKGADLLNLNQENPLVLREWNNFFKAVQKGIICDKQADDPTAHTLSNNVELRNYKSQFGAEKGNDITFYSGLVYQIEERDENNEIVIRNKNLEDDNPEAYIDCIEGLFLDDTIQLDESLLVNTFYEEFEINRGQWNTPVNCDTKPNLQARADILNKTAQLLIPIYIVKKDIAGTTKLVRHNIKHNISLPFKSKFTGPKNILMDFINSTCDVGDIHITATIDGEEFRDEPFRDAFTDFELENVKLFFEDKYDKIIPHILRIHKQELVTIGGQDFEYRLVGINDRKISSNQVLIKSSEYTSDPNSNGLLPCKTKIEQAIRNLTDKLALSKNRYHQPLFDFLDDIAKKDGPRSVNILDDSSSFSPTIARLDYYRRVLSAGSTRVVFNELNGVTHLVVSPTETIITGNSNSLIEKMYDTLDPEIYNSSLESYNNGTNTSVIPLADAKQIYAPKAPNIDKNDLGTLLEDTPEENLRLPPVYRIEITKLQALLESGKWRHPACGDGLLGVDK